MVVWANNTIMEWRHQNGTWLKITDHNRSGLSETFERLENKQRMVDGTLRKHVVAKKRSFACSWSMLPSNNTKNGGLHTADGGLDGIRMEDFHREHDDAFQIRLRDGTGTTPPLVVTVMISDFTKEVVKRGALTDLWNLDITLEEV